jgi:hypothetical protein
LRHRQSVPTIDGMSLQTKCIGVRRFVDGFMRPIFEDPTGRQFVTDNMERVYGVWLTTDAAEQLAPLVVLAERNCRASYPVQ